MALEVVPAATKLGAGFHRQMHSRLTEVRYAHPEGSNSNDGMTWGTAKADVVSAYDALPSSGGDVYVADSTFMDSVNTDRGLWIAGVGDPNYGSLPTGWRQNKNVLRLIGAGVAQQNANSKFPQVLVRGGSTTDRNKPTMWLSGTANAMTFENLLFQYPAIAWRIGIDSDGADITQSVSSLTVRNCGWDLNEVVGNGPGMEMGYLFWVNLQGITARGNPASYTITACSINAGTTARFTIGTHFLKAGDTVNVAGVTPSGYNGYWTVSAIAATTFDADIGTSPGAGSLFGTTQPVRSYRRAAIAHDSRDIFPSAVGPANRFYIQDGNFNSGHLHYVNGTSQGGGQFVVRNITHEGNGAVEPPTVDLRGNYALGGGITNTYQVLVENVEIADAAAPNYALNVDGEDNPYGLAIAINASSNGNVLNFGGTATTRRQTGLFGAFYQGRAMATDRTFGAVPVLATNSAVQDVSTWSSLGAAQDGGAATITTGKLAPDGTTQAASLTGGSNGGRGVCGGMSIAGTLGDWIICGVWRRYVSGTADDWNEANFQIKNVAGYKLNNGNAAGFTLQSTADDGAWEWTWAAGKITTSAGGSPTLFMDIRNRAGAEIQYYAPIVLYLSGASYDDDEVRSMIWGLRSWPDGIAAGDIGIPRGQNLVFAGNGGVRFNEQSDPAAPAANKAILYSKDNGSGKTQLVARFPTGAVQVIATEP